MVKIAVDPEVETARACVGLRLASWVRAFAGGQTEWNRGNRFRTTLNTEGLSCATSCVLAVPVVPAKTSVGLRSKFVYGHQAGAILRGFR